MKQLISKENYIASVLHLTRNRRHVFRSLESLVNALWEIQGELAKIVKMMEKEEKEKALERERRDFDR